LISTQALSKAFSLLSVTLDFYPSSLKGILFLGRNQECLKVKRMPLRELGYKSRVSEGKKNAFERASVEIKSV
jgi:hypothetical protein